MVKLRVVWGGRVFLVVLSKFQSKGFLGKACVTIDFRNYANIVDTKVHIVDRQGQFFIASPGIFSTRCHNGHPPNGRIIILRPSFGLRVRELKSPPTCRQVLEGPGLQISVHSSTRTEPWKPVILFKAFFGKRPCNKMWIGSVHNVDRNSIGCYFGTLAGERGRNGIKIRTRIVELSCTATATRSWIIKRGLISSGRWPARQGRVLTSWRPASIFIGFRLSSTRSTKNMGRFATILSAWIGFWCLFDLTSRGQKRWWRSSLFFLNFL